MWYLLNRSCESDRTSRGKSMVLWLCRESQTVVARCGLRKMFNDLSNYVKIKYNSVCYAVGGRLQPLGATKRGQPCRRQFLCICCVFARILYLAQSGTIVVYFNVLLPVCRKCMIF